MRTNIVIDDDLINEAMTLSKFIGPNKKAKTLKKLTWKARMGW